MIQNLEGGIVKEILVSEGDFVKQGDILLKIANEKSQSTYQSNNLKSLEIRAKIVRLKAEANNNPFLIKEVDNKTLIEYLNLEEKLYRINKESKLSKINILKEQIVQNAMI